MRYTITMKFGSRAVFAVFILSTLFAVSAGDDGLEQVSHAAKKRAAADARSAPVFGIQQRVPWTTSRITGSLESPLPYKIQRAFPKLKFDQLVDFATAPGSDRYFVVELGGRISSFKNDPNARRADLFFDLTQHIPDARRAMAVTFHPQFEKNRYVYICYVKQENDPKGSRVSRFKVRDTDPPVCDPESETVLVEWFCGGHNGCCLKFSPRDGCLYISTGDGTSPSPPDGKATGQDVSDLLSSILRIDVDHPQTGKPYGIPADNPFVDLEGARPEIWAYGFRNPWRMSFDPVTGWLWVGDVGWEMWEMVYRVQRGGNYGWSIVEGRQSVRPELEPGPTPILPPVAAHSHVESRSVTGGYVYRGSKYKDLQGAYIYGDYVTGKIWGLRYDGETVTWQRELANSPLAIIAFGLDHDGELFVLDHAGTLNRLVPNTASGFNKDFPRKLSQTGLFASVRDHTPAPGVIEYSINAEPWHDGAVAQRYIAVPGTGKLSVWETTNTQVGYIKGNWLYPNDTVLVKTLSLEMEEGNPESRRRLETQIMHRDGDVWRPYTYIWNDEQTDALLAPAEGVDRAFTIVDPDAKEPDSESPALKGQARRRQQTWHFAARTECLVCHTTRGGSIYGFVPPQLNKTHNYNGVQADQLASLTHVELFDDPYAEPNANPENRVSRLANPSGLEPESQSPALTIEDRARAYLHLNCAHCHRRGGGGTAKFELQYHLNRDKLQLIGERPSQGTFNIHAAMNVAAGDPYRSVLYYRLAKLGAGHMPKIGSNAVDVDGLRLIHDWIAGLPNGDPAQTDATSTAKLRAAQRAAIEELISGDAQRRDQPAVAAIGPAIDKLLASTSGALMLLSALDAGRFSDSVRNQVLAKATVHPAPEVRGLFERFVPEEKRVKRLGTVIRPEEILALNGDARRGNSLFFKAAGVQCRNCHQIDRQGKPLGPDLSEIGKKYDRAALLETILEPSKKIEQKYLAYIAETTEGRVLTGLLEERTARQVVLKDAEGKLIRVPADEIELLAPQRKSLMPELLLREMTAQQVADLLAYLDSLK